MRITSCVRGARGERSPRALGRERTPEPRWCGVGHGASGRQWISDETIDNTLAGRVSLRHSGGGIVLEAPRTPCRRHPVAVHLALIRVELCEEAVELGLSVLDALARIQALGALLVDTDDEVAFELSLAQLAVQP